MDRKWKKYVSGVIVVLLGFGVTSSRCFGADQATQDRLNAAITTLNDKISQVNNEQNLKTNLQELQKNLNAIYREISINPLSSDIIYQYLRRQLKQSSFHHGMNFILHQKSDVGAHAPMTPFKLQEGASSQDIIRQQWEQGFDPIRIPVHPSVDTFTDQGTHQPLAPYAYPQGHMNRDITNDENCVALFQASLGIQVAFNPQELRSQLTDQQKCNIIRALAYTQPNFSQRIIIRKLQPGEVLTRCAQRHTIEPGSWWTRAQDMPTSVKAVREGTAVLPDWNQTGKLEFFVVPEGCDLVVLEGLAAAQCLREYDIRNPDNPRMTRKGRYYKQDTNEDVTNHYLQGGTNQIFITGNINGAAFVQNLLRCVTILDTGFEVEASVPPRY